MLLRTTQLISPSNAAEGKLGSIELNLRLAHLVGLPLLGLKNETRIERILVTLNGAIILFGLYWYVIFEIYDLSLNFQDLDKVTQNLVMTLTHSAYLLKTINIWYHYGSLKDIMSRLKVITRVCVLSAKQVETFHKAEMEELVIPARSKTMNKYKGLVLIVLLINSIKADIPGCDYFDTVKLLPTQKLANGSYQYENIIIPPEQTGEYDYEIHQGGDREEVEKHLRGCACHLGTCIRFCCQKNALLVEDERKCSADIIEELDFDPMVDLTLNNGTVVRRHVLNEFIVQHDLPVPCSAHFHLDALNEANEGWTLFENGTLLRHYGSKSLSKQDYCLQPHQIRDPLTNGSIISLVPHNCFDKQKSQTVFNLLRILSMIFLILTIIVYLSFDKLRNLHGLCFVNYMICIFVVFAALMLEPKVRMFLRPCQLIGYLGYFAAMAGFNWLTVISYDLWVSFKGNNYNVERKAWKMLFCKYNMYAWGVAMILTLIVMILDGTLDWDDESLLNFIPGVSFYTCWIKTFDWSSMLYFHGIIAVQLIFNIIMFTLTAIRIVQVKNELKNLTLPEERAKHIHLNKQSFGMFLRLFVIMGIMWTFEVFGYLSIGHPWETFFSIFDYVNCAQGIIIFILFVFKRSVLKLIWNRCRGIRSTNDEDGSEEEIALQNRNGASKNVGPNILK